MSSGTKSVIADVLRTANLPAYNEQEGTPGYLLVSTPKGDVVQVCYAPAPDNPPTRAYTEERDRFIESAATILRNGLPTYVVAGPNGMHEPMVLVISPR